MSSSRLRFLVNPAAGRGRGVACLDRIRVIASRLEAGLVVSRKQADLAEAARGAVRDGVERLLVVGGDGTMHHAAQGLAGSDCALGVIPLGTGNDLAGTLGVPKKLERAIEVAARGPVRRIDLVRVAGTYCIGYAGVGFDSEVTRCANEVRRLRGSLVYPYAVVSTLFTFRPPAMKVVYDGGVFEGPVMFAVAANLPRFGGGMRIAPQAAIDDGLLDLVIVRQISKAQLLRVFPKVYSGKHVGHAAVFMTTTRCVEITIDQPLAMYGGGEMVTPMRPGEPVGIEVVPGALAVVSG